MGQPQGGFSINGVKCPSCDGSLDLQDGADVVVCTFCGTTVHVSYSHSSQTSGVELDGTIRDRGTGYGLFRVQGAPGWQVTGATLQQRGSASRPYVPQAELRDRSGGVISLSMGDAGTRNSAGMDALMKMYGGHLRGVDTANYAPMPDPVMLADTTASGLASSMGGAGLRFVTQLQPPNLEEQNQRCFARFQQYAQAQGAMVANPFAAVVLRTYETACNGQPWKLAVYAVLSAVKDASGVGEGLGLGGLGGLGNLGEIGGSVMSGLGDLFGSIGGLFGGQGQQQQQSYQMQQSQQYPMRQQMPPQMQQPMQQQSPSVAWSTADLSQYSQSGTIYWSVSPVVTYSAPAESFDAHFKSVFIPLASTIEIHADVERLSLTAAQQEAAQIRGATQTQLSQNQAAFQAQQAAHRQQQAAFDAYNQSITDARNAHHQQFMASSHEQFNHSAPDYSEAIRGVNTYTTSDGREVELTVHADHAWENQAGDVIGTPGSFKPGADWIEIPRT